MSFERKTHQQLLEERTALVVRMKDLNDKLDAYKPVEAKSDTEKAAAKVARDAYKATLETFYEVKEAVDAVDDQIRRHKAMLDAERSNTVDLPGQQQSKVFAGVETDVYASKAAAEARGLMTNKGLVFGGISRMLGAGSVRDAVDRSTKLYGENHPITKALVAGIGGSGGFIIPPEYINEIIELLRPKAVVRSANPRLMPMPRGTMTLPSQTGAATAGYGAEASKIPVSQQTLGQIIASYKKLTALVPISNDLMRFADPAADAFVRDDLVKVMALREDLAFMLGDGTQNSPRGFISFANEYALQQGGSAGIWLSSANSTYASGGNFITSAESITDTSVSNELGGLVNRLDTANVPDDRRVWFMHPRTYNYLFNKLNSLGLYVYRDELMTGTLLTYPVKRSTQIPINIKDTTSANTVGASFIMLAEMTEAMILDSMTLELFISREGSYTDAGGNQVNLVEKDQTLIRAIAEHDFQLRHPAAVAVLQGVIWAPAIQ